MHEFTYENQGQNTYLVYHFDDSPVDTMALGMLTNNRIKGFAQALYTEVNNERYVKYNVSSHVTLDKLFMGEVRKNRILKTFINIIDALMGMDAYMLDRRTVLLDTDYIYVDASTSEVDMICVPVVEDSEPADEREFFKNIIFSVTFSQKENGDYVARMLAYLNGAENFSLPEFREQLERLLTEQSGRPVQQGAYAGQQGMPQIQQGNPYQNPGINQMAAQAAAALPPQMQTPQNIQYGAVPQLQGDPSNAGREPDIQNVYVASAKDVKMAKREEIQRQQEEEKARQAAMNPIVSDNMDMGFAVPGMSKNQHGSKPKASAAAAPSGKAASTEDDVSLFYLLQHYNKENKEKYKATKERKKSGGTQAKTSVQPAKPAQNQIVKQVVNPRPQQTAYSNAQYGRPNSSQQSAPKYVPQTPQNTPQYGAQAQQNVPQYGGTQAQQSVPQYGVQAQQNAPQYGAQAQQSVPQYGAQVQQSAPQYGVQAQQSAPQYGVQAQQSAPQYGAQAQQSAPQYGAQMQQGSADEFEQTVLMGGDMDDDMGTVILNESSKAERRPYLYQVKNGKKIYLDKKTNRIGKNREVVDICIDGNPAISRCHAIIYKLDGVCYIEDLNSTNGTFVGGSKIVSNNKTIVQVGERIKLGDEEFELRYDG